MSKVKPPEFVMNRREVVAKIKYGMNMQAAKAADIALVAHMTEPTLYSRFRNPEEFRMRELVCICKKLHLSLTDVLNCYT